MAQVLCGLRTSPACRLTGVRPRLLSVFSWLRRQTEKQRVIWGYKILFLDVLFPLKLKRVIFTDADQVSMRADVHDLCSDWPILTKHHFAMPDLWCALHQIVRGDMKELHDMVPILRLLAHSLQHM